MYLVDLIQRLTPTGEAGGGPAENTVLAADGITFDSAHRRAMVDGYVVHVPSCEAVVLEVLMNHAGRRVHRVELLDALHTDDVELLDRYAHRLMRRLQPSPLSPPRVRPVEDFGYQFA
jgi:DNA-binding response OmpR family regulator